MGINNFLLLRHGKTEWNLEGRLQGRQNTCLINGENVDFSCANYLQNQRFSKVFLSPLLRVQQTFELYKGFIHIKEYETVDCLTEMSFGECEGMTMDEISKAYPDMLEKRKKNKLTFKWPGGESIVSLKVRVRNFVNKVESQKFNNTVLVIAHEMVNKSIISLLNKDSEPNIWYARIFNNEVCIIDANGNIATRKFSELKE